MNEEEKLEMLDRESRVAREDTDMPLSRDLDPSLCLLLGVCFTDFDKEDRSQRGGLTFSDLTRESDDSNVVSLF